MKGRPEALLRPLWLLVASFNAGVTVPGGSEAKRDTVDGYLKSGINSPVEVASLSTIIYKVLYIPGGFLAGFQPSTVGIMICFWKVFNMKLVNFLIEKR